jgi:hypothetical protein
MLIIFGFEFKNLICNQVSKTALIHHRTIRSILAAGLLALFALAVTPKIALHALVAHHTDTHLRLDYGAADQLNKAGFHCATDNLVVEFPFLQHDLFLAIGGIVPYAVFRAANLDRALTTPHPLYGLRGPPADHIS